MQIEYIAPMFTVIGVIVGIFLKWLIDWIGQVMKNKKDAEHLAVHVICLLNKFVAGCAAVVEDNGQPDSSGVWKPNTVRPNFEPDTAKVEWKSLPKELMYQVLMLPNRIEVANLKINAVDEYVAYGPDYCDFFEERQFQYAMLGIRAAEAADALRKHAALPSEPIDDWDAVECMREKLKKIERFREEQRNHHNKGLLSIYCKEAEEKTGSLHE
jgi:hypothetical protein